MDKVKVSASILSCDFLHLNDEIKKIENSKADSIHLDIMDGHFVKNFSFGQKIVSLIRKSTKLFLDTHLMIYNPFDYIEEFVASGSNRITFHLEATEDIEDTIKFIKTCGIQAGISINPETSFLLIEKYLFICDKVLFMSVHPGFGGQKFLSKVLDKVKLAKNIKDKNKLNIDIAIDGGIDNITSKLAKDAGANLLISGNYLFSSKDMKEAVSSLRAT